MRPRLLVEFLKKAHVPFTPFRHPAAVGAQHEAALSHVPGRSWAKTVICLADDEAILAVVPAHVMVDLEALRVLAAATMLRLAREVEIVGLYPGCEVGAISPLAIGRSLRVFVDRSLVGEPDLVFNAGTETDAVRMHYGDFAELTGAIVGSFGQRRG